MSFIILDFETASMCDLKAAGAYRYAEDLTTEVLCLQYAKDDSPVRTWLPDDPVPADLAGWIAEGVPMVAHNVQFEKSIWRCIMVPIFGFPAVPNSQWHDTMAVCAMRALPQKLDKVTSVLRLPHQKDLEGSRLTIGLSRIDKKTGMLPARTPAILERVAEYCVHDVLAQRGLHKRVGWLPPGEREVFLLNQRVNDRGLRLDMDLVRSMQDVVDRASEPLMEEYRGLTGGLSMTQLDKTHNWLLGQGVVLPNMQKETLEAVLGVSEDEDANFQGAAVELPDNVHRALSIRHLIGSSSIKKLTSMEACVGSDGRARGLLQYHGTMPGRQAGRLFQPHNFPRGSVDGSPDAKVAALMTRDLDWITVTCGPPVEACVSALRHVLVPDKGRVYVAGDLAGIQARTVLALAGQHDKTALMAAGADIYCDMASQIYKRPIDKKKDPEERQIGKNSVLGLGFQMGAPKFHWKYGKGQTLEFMQEVVRVYRKEWAPCVPDVWQGLSDAALAAVRTGQPHEAYGIEYRLVDAWLTARLPSGRLLWYYNPQVVRRHMPWSTPEEPDVRWAWTYQTQKSGKWITVDAFGGLLTENVVMGIERDLMVNASFLAEKNGFPIVLEVHDELLTEPLSADADEKALDQIMTDVPQWCKLMQIPVATEVWAGDRYKK